MSNLKALAVECSALMDAVEAEGFNGSSDDERPDARLTRISEIANILEAFAPELLDKRFNYAE